ncbi:DUF2268 domain-containing protein [Halobacillus litoralis]|uniref:DUF2268 domain-containing protein n=1 Tax=Halobacillus litoralis TaxID=45668 RepID=UPI001CD3EAFA|nr:DUF2268 domain-containing putative Zn-dependent protease [Halobacillus litoralis]MCA0970662.1 DUF2268 domain-containing protein [Halobacillus litoralis]
MRNLMIGCLALFLIIVGCERSISKTDDPVKEQGNEEERYIIESNAEDGQSLQVVSAYKYVEKYVEKAEKTEDHEERKVLWRELVMNEVRDSCLNGPYFHLVQEYVLSPPQDLENLKDEIEALRDSGSEEVVLEALEKSAGALPGPDTTVCLLPLGDLELDVSGVTVGAGTISIVHQPYTTHQSIRQVVAHEYHHSAWTADSFNGEKMDLLDAIIFEGKAEYFADSLYGEPLIEPGRVSEEEVKKLWNRAKESLDTTDDREVREILYGGEDGFPYGFGYVAGYRIVQEYVKSHPDTTMEELTRLNAESLYQKSGYDSIQ